MLLGGEIAPQEQFLLIFTIFCNLILDFCVKTGTRFSHRDKRLFEITEVEITRVDCICIVHVFEQLRVSVLSLQFEKGFKQIIVKKLLSMY